MRDSALGRAAIGALLLAAATSTTTSSSAQANEHPRVVLDVDRCVDVNQAEVRRIVGVELGALLALDGEASGPDTTRIFVRCAPAGILLHVDDPITQKAIERTLDLSVQASMARARLLALAIAEIVTASWTELEVNPSPQVRAAGSRPSTASRAAARAVVRARTALSPALAPNYPLRLASAFSIRSYLGHTGILAGGVLRLAQDRELFGWSLDAAADYGSQAFGIGRIDTTTISLAPALVVHRSIAPLVVRAGFGARVGAAIHAGSTNNPTVLPSTVAGPFAGPMTLISFSVVPKPPLVLELTLDGGWVTLPVTALVGTTHSVAIDGGWIGATIGVGFFP